MKKILLLSVVLVAGALVLGACDAPFASNAAQVDGASISRTELLNTLHDANSSVPFRCLLNEQTPTTGAGVSSTYNSIFAAQQLTLLVERQIVSSALARLHLQSTPLAVSLAKQEIYSGLTGSTGGSCTATGQQVYASLPASYAGLLLTLQTDQNTLSAYIAGATLTDAGLASFTRAHPNLTALNCVSAIVVATQAKATALRTAIESGSSFANVAKANSTDSSSAANGGALGCLYPGELTSPLNSAVEGLAIGTVSTPIGFSGSYVLLEVTSRKPGTATGAATALVSAESTAEAAYAASLSAKSNVVIDSQYGTWKKSSGSYAVVSTKGPLNAVLPNSNAVTPLGAVYS